MQKAKKAEEDDDESEEDDGTKWNRINKRALALLLQAVSVDLQETVINESSIASAWKALKDQFDRETPSTTITLLKAVITNTLSETRSIPDHIVSFEAAWNRLNHRTASNQDTNALHKALHSLTASVEAKGAFLLMSLPPSMQTEVDSLQARQALTYEDVRDLLQNKATD